MNKEQLLRNTIKEAALRLEVATNIIEKDLCGDEDDISESRSYIAFLRKTAED